jgi:large subunit ribosomal protein L25
MEVPVRITGRSKGVVAGGVLRQSFRKLKVKAIPANLPDEIVVDVTPLRIGNKLYVGGIKTEGYSFVHPDNAVVVAVKMSRNAMKGGAVAEDDEDEEAAEEVATQSPDVPTTEEKSAE